MVLWMWWVRNLVNLGVIYLVVFLMCLLNVFVSLLFCVNVVFKLFKRFDIFVFVLLFCCLRDVKSYWWNLDYDCWIYVFNVGLLIIFFW